MDDRRQMILGQDLRFTATIGTAMPIDSLDRLPLRSSQVIHRCGRFTRTAFLDIELILFRVGLMVCALGLTFLLGVVLAMDGTNSGEFFLIGLVVGMLIGFHLFRIGFTPCLVLCGSLCAQLFFVGLIPLRHRLLVGWALIIRMLGFRIFVGHGSNSSCWASDGVVAVREVRTFGLQSLATT